MSISGVKRERTPEADFANLPKPFMEGLVAFQDFGNNLTLRTVCSVWRETMSPLFDRNVRWLCSEVSEINEPLYSNVRFLSLDFHQDVSLIPPNVEEVEIYNSEASLQEVEMMRFPRLEWLRKIIINGGLDKLMALDLSELPGLEHLDLAHLSGKLHLPQAATLKTLITGDEFSEPLDLSGQTSLESLEIKHFNYRHLLNLENLNALKELKIPYNFEPTLIRIGVKLCIVPLITLPICFPKAWSTYKIEIIQSTVRFFT